MALRYTGGLVAKTLFSNAVNASFIPSTINLQVRYAARKGYREQARKKHAVLKAATQTVSKEVFKLKQKFVKIEKTVELQKPDIPNDDVFIINSFKHKKFSFSEAIQFHKEYHHPTVCNNPSAPIYIRIEFNMIGNKKTQILKPFRGIAPIPHPFNTGSKREVLVFCGPEYVDEALKSGATIAGGTDLVDKIKTGYIQPSLYEFLLCHVKFLPELTPIRNIIKTQMPRPKAGTLTNDLPRAIPKFLHGIEYSCVKVNPTDDFGIVDCQIGDLEMPTEHIEANLKALLADIEAFRPKREGDFVTWMWCRSPPSKEQFTIDMSSYVDTPNMEDDDDEEEEISDKEKLRQILTEFEEKETESKMAS